MKGIRYVPRPKEKVELGGEIYELALPRVKAYPLILELSNLIRDNPTLTPKAIDVYSQIAQITFEYSYPEVDKKEIESILNDYLDVLIKDYGYVLTGTSKDKINEIIATNKMVEQNPKLKN